MPEELTVVFPRACTGEAFEDLLRKHYSPSLAARTVTFTLEEVRWIDIACVSLTVLWISELRRQHAGVTVVFPISGAVSRLLDSYAISSYLKMIGVHIVRGSSREFRAVTSDLPRAPLYPLTFFSAESFQSLITDLHNPNRMALVFGDLTRSEIISSGAIRDIILSELIDNIFEHAGGRLGHMIMTKTTAAPAYHSNTAASTHLGPLGSIERRYLNKLDGGEYINIVIGDKGPGIDATLRQSYIASMALDGNSTNKISECDVLDFSFKYAATRRLREERLAKITQILKGDLNIVPATGLFGVREIVKHYYGYIQIRSGRSLLCYDFLGYDAADGRDPDDPVLVSCQTEGMKRLANFGGTQFKIMLPVHLSIRWKKRPGYVTRGRIRTPDQRDKPQSLYLSLTSAKGLMGVKDEASILLLFQEQISQIRSLRQEQSWIFVFDLEGYQGLSVKALHYLTYMLLSDQQDTELTLLVNAPKTLVLSIAGEPQRPAIALGKALALIDDEREVYLLSDRGLFAARIPNAKNAELFQERWKTVLGEDLELEELNDKIRSLSHLFLREGVKEALRQIIFSPEHRVYDPSLRVRLPSDVYCEGFFDLTVLYRYDPFRLLLSEWVALWVQDLSATVLVVVGSHLANILESLRQPVRIIPLLARRGSLVEVRSGLGQLSEEDKVILITDVLGTGKTAQAAMAAMENVRQLNVLGVVDASWPEEDSDCPVTLTDAVAKGSVRYFTDLPRGWDISSIWEVDPRTRHLVRVRREESEPLWKQIFFSQPIGFTRAYRSNELFTNLTVSPGILSAGHFVSNERHMTYLFNIAAVAQNYCEEIASIIHEDSEAAIMSLGPEFSVRQIVYPVYNPGLQLIARSLARLFPACEVFPVDREDLLAASGSPARRERSSAAIIVDDAFESGETIFRLIDWAERQFFSLILVYPLIRRGSEESGRRFQKISSYGGAKVHMQFLTEATIPTFAAHSCPVCENTFEWTRAEDKLTDCEPIKSLVKQRLEQMLPKSVAAISQEQLILPLGETEGEHRIMGELRWRLEIARRLHIEKEYFLELLAPQADPIPKNILLRVMSHDRFIENLPNDERSTFFDRKLRSAVVAHAEKILMNIKSMPLSVIDDALVVLLNLDIDAFNAHFRKALAQAFTLGTAVLGWIVTFTIRKQSQITAVSLVLQVLIELDQRCGENDSRREIIDEAVKLWRLRQDEVNALRESRVNDYRELIGGRLHEVSHLKEDLINRTQEKPVDVEAIARSWEAMELEMRERIFPLLRKFWRTEMNQSFRDAFFANFDALRYQLEEGVAVVDDLKRMGRGQGYDHEVVQALASLLGAIAFRSEDLVFGEKGLRKSLYTFRQDLHELIHSVIQQRKGEIEALKMKVTTVLPDEDCLVFGDDVALRQVLHILIDNILEHSGASKILFDASIEIERGRVLVSVLDNGKGFKSSAMGEGLRRAKGILAAYSSSLRIKAFSSSSKQYPGAGYRTSVLLNLVHLPSRRKLQ